MRNTKRLVTDGLCAALYVVLSSFLSLNLGPIKLSISGLPVILAALLFGPADGLTVGLLGGFLGQLTGPYGVSVTTPLWMLPVGVLGFIPAGTPRARALPSTGSSWPCSPFWRCAPTPPSPPG